MTIKELALKLLGEDWRVEESDVSSYRVTTIKGRIITCMLDRETAEQIVRDHNAVQKLVEPIKLAIQYGENEYVESELDAALAALEQDKLEVK